MSGLRHIRVLSDGRPGHENQSVGLALALGRRTGANFEIVKLDPAAGVWARMRASVAMGAGQGGDHPQLVIAAGHRTHVPLWWAARQLGARSVVIMKPSLPLAFFDLALVPMHDVASGAQDTARRILTRGALNRVPEESREKTASGLVLIGGPSKHHGWDGAALAPCIMRVMAAQPELSWTVADSRRTPEGFLAELEVPAGVRVSKVPHQETGPAWLAGELAKARVVWATEDSVSMVHEAVTAGAATGVLPAPAKGKPGRIHRAVRGLIAEGYAIEYVDWERNGCLRTGGRLQESARCAEVILARWFGGTLLP